MNKTMNTKIDREWVELLLSAKKIGLSIEEVRQFLKVASSQESAKSYRRGVM